MTKLNSNPKRDLESVGLPPLKQPAGRTCADSTGMDSGSGEKPEGTKVVVSGKTRKVPAVCWEEAWLFPGP